MKIALVSPYDFAYPSGVVNHISTLERYLSRMGHDVRVIAPASRTVTTFGDRFIPIGRPRPIPASGSILRITISLRLASTIKEILEREKFDLVHLHEPFMPMLCSAVLRFSNVPNIGTFHACDGRPGYEFGKPVGTYMLKRRRNKLNGKIAVSKPAMDYASKYVPGDYTIIPNGVDTENFSPDVTPVEEFCDGKLNILFLSRLERRKGLKYLLEAYQEVKREIPASRLIVVGAGSRPRKKHEKWVRQRELEDVVFIGYINEEEKPRYYKTADVFCVPATGHESFGIILIEAMILGKPVVTTNIEGYSSVITHGKEGLLVTPKNSLELAQALFTLLRDEKLRKQMGENGKITAQQYGWECLAQKVNDYYVKVINEVSNNGTTNPV